MKTVIIIVLGAALGTAAFATRPSQGSFEKMVREHVKQSTSNNFFAKLGMSHKINSFIDGCSYKDRYLWVDVVKDGKTVYCGAFSHWFDLSGKTLPVSTQQ